MRQAGRRLPEYQGIGKQGRRSPAVLLHPGIGAEALCWRPAQRARRQLVDRDRRLSDDVEPLKRGEHPGILGISHTTRAVLPEVKLPLQPRIQLAVKDYKGVKEVGADYLNAGD
jgi:hypothetical protein